MVNIGAADSGSSAAGAATRRSPLRKLYVQVLIAIAIGILLAGQFPRDHHDEVDVAMGVKVAHRERALQAGGQERVAEY